MSTTSGMTAPRAVHEGATWRTHLVRLMRALVADLRFIAWNFVVNMIGGSGLMPRFGRYLIYRSAGLDIHSPKFFHGCTFTSRDVHFARNSGASWNCLFEGGPIHIGENTMIGMQAIFTTGNHPLDDRGMPRLTNEPKPIVVGADCWFGARVTVLSGVTIADRVTVAAGAVVTKDLLQPGIYAGVPAKLVKAWK